ncbi:MAG: hypothetical protein HY332_00230 [Chloroflexi bacterium]|nr:hypothetical protein [Chloroflexota bacterium]
MPVTRLDTRHAGSTWRCLLLAIAQRPQQEPQRAVIDLSSFGATLYALSPHAWHYNKTVLKESGAPDPWEKFDGKLTWEDMLQIAKLTSRPAQGDRPQRWGIWLNYTDIEYQLAGFIWSNGGRAHDYTTGPRQSYRRTNFWMRLGVSTSPT